MNAKEVLEFAKKNNVEIVDLSLHRLARAVAALLVPDQRARRGHVRGRHRLRRLVDPRLAGDQRVRHADDPGSGDGVHRSRSSQHPTLVLICDIVRPDHARAVLARPALHRAQGRGVPQVDRHRRHRVLRSRGRVLHLRRRALQHRPRTRLLLASTRTRARGTPGRDEGGANLGYKPRHKEGYFPVPPTDTPAGHPHRDGARRWRSSASRSRRSTTRWRPPVRPRSTCASTRWSRWPTS